MDGDIGGGSGHISCIDFRFLKNWPCPLLLNVKSPWRIAPKSPVKLKKGPCHFADLRGLYPKE